MKEDMNPREGLPTLGTREAAFKACVCMIAHLCGQPEETVQYWLDLYYQVRLAWAVEEDRIRREDRRVEHGLQVMRESVRTDAGADQDSVQDHAPVMAQAAEASAALAIASKQAAETAGEPRGFEPIAPNRGGAPHGNTYGADAADFKRETVRRLRQMRAEGLTIAKIVSISNGSIKEESVLDILAAKRVPIAVYRLLAAVLDKIEE